MNRFRIIFAAATLALVTGSFTLPMGAQSPSATPRAEKWNTPRNETADQRMARTGLAVDPGLNPDPAKTFVRYGKQWRIAKVEKKWAVYDDPRANWVRSFGNANFAHEIYREDDQSIWVFFEVLPPPEPLKVVTNESGDEMQIKQHSAEEIAYFQKIKPEFEPLSIPQANVTVRFEESSAGLPDKGSWRNSLDVADMNKDGFADIIAPPQRGGTGSVPAIYLGDGRGNWTYWKASSYPRGLNYGSIVAADLNRDGHQDLVLGVHLFGVAVLLGNSKGEFIDGSAGLPTKFPTRRVIVTDVDRDGYPDLVAISEGPTMNSEQIPRPTSRLKAFLNNGKGNSWKELDIADEKRSIGGDFLSSGDLNGDKYPDFFGASIYFNGPDTLYVSKGKNKWDPVGRGELIPFLSYYWASAMGKFTGKKTDEAVISYLRSWPQEIDPEMVSYPSANSVSGLDLLSWTGGKPQRAPIVRWANQGSVWGLDSGDFNGDGKLDLVYMTNTPRAMGVLLGDGKGKFNQATVEGVELQVNNSYDIKSADVNGDKRPDLLIMYESNEKFATSGKNGAIRVFINRSGNTSTASRTGK